MADNLNLPNISTVGIFNWQPIDSSRDWNPEDLSGATIESHAGRMDPIHEGTLTRHGTFVRHYYYRVGYSLR